MQGTKKVVNLVILAGLLIWAGSAQAASISGSAGMTVLQDGPNAEGVFYKINVNYEAFDGTDATDPLGVTPGKLQFAYILEYVDGNTNLGVIDLESINGVPLIETGTSTNGTVNGLTPGDMAPIGSGIITLASGNPSARFLYSLAGDSMFGPAGARSVILAFTVSNEYGVGSILATGRDTSLGGVAEVAGPNKHCRGIVEGTVFCLNCGPNGQIALMEGVTVKVLSDGNEVASTLTLKDGQYIIPDVNIGDYTVVAGSGSTYSPCSKNSAAVTVTCDEPAVAGFCVCPTACQQQITVRVICDQTGTAVPVPKAWVGISGTKILRWTRTKADGTRTFNGSNIVAGHYKVMVSPPKGYEMSGNSTVEFDLASCESKEVVFKVCPIPPCTQSVCVSVVKAPVCGDSNNLTPVAGINVTLNCTTGRKGVTDASGRVCFDKVELGSHTATITVPQSYRLCDGDNKVKFCLNRCDQKSVQFVLTAIPYGPCPKMPNYWKQNPNIWPNITFMWVGADELAKIQLMNILNGKLPNGSKAKSGDVSLELAQYLIAAKLSIAAGSDIKDIGPVVVGADEFLLYDYPPGCSPSGKGAQLAKDMKNKLVDWLKDCSYCQGSGN